jgi:selenocysteine lyase/cysteine desulfurase
MVEQIPRHPISSAEVAFWEGVRREFYLRDEVTYLQGGTVGPSARPTIERVAELQRLFEEDPLHNRYTGPLPEARERSRAKLAAFVGTRPERIALVLNTTMAMNIPARGLQFEAGGEILLSDQEYGSTRNIWEVTARRHGLALCFVDLPLMPASPAEIVAAYASGMTPQTRVVLFSHVYYTTGLVTPVRALTELAHENGAVAVVDGAHAPGMVPLELDAWDCDFYGASCHKWLLAPKGVGFAYVAERHAAGMEPPLLGFPLSASSDASRFEVPGVCDWTHAGALETALDFQLRIGWESRIRPYCLALARYLKDKLVEEIPKARLTVPVDVEMSGFIVSFHIEGVDAQKVCNHLWETYRIEVVYTPAYGLSCFRVSTHFYAAFADLDRFLEALVAVSQRPEMQLE